MSPPPEEIVQEIDKGIRKYMVLILSYVDNINGRTIALQNEMTRLKYLLELKKAKRLSMKADGDDIDMIGVEADQKKFETKRKMYVGKLNK